MCVPSLGCTARPRSRVVGRGGGRHCGTRGAAPTAHGCHDPHVAGWDDVSRLARALPGVVEDPAGTTTAWRIGSRAFAWERLLRPGELRLLGERAPTGPALGLRVPDATARGAWLAELPDVFFLVPHYEPHPMVLVHVERAPFEVLDEALTEAWLCRASKRAAQAYLDAARTPGDG